MPYAYVISICHMHMPYAYDICPFWPSATPAGFFFFSEKSTFDFSKSLLAECYARRGFFFVKNQLLIFQSPSCPNATPAGAFFS